MELRKWRPWYLKILARCAFSEEEDQRSTDLLSHLLRAKSAKVDLEAWRKRIIGKNVLVCGAGPSLKRDLRHVVEQSFNERCVLVAADGATTALLEESLTPEFVLSDLDGRIQDILQAQINGARIIIHAHGDNIDVVRKFVPAFKPSIIGTTEAKPRSRVYNFGGFTDGDRCAFFADEFGARKVILIGMDFGRSIGSYSKKGRTLSVYNLVLKRKKLKIARELLSWLASWSQAEFVDATSSRSVITGIAKCSIQTLAQNPAS